MGRERQPNFLFVCSQNWRRSLTAELVFAGSNACHVKSAGTEATARTVVGEELISWADVIFVMETEHEKFLRARFRASLRSKTVINLDIPDIYRPMDPALIARLKASLLPYLQLPHDKSDPPGPPK